MPQPLGAQSGPGDWMSFPGERAIDGAELEAIAGVIKRRTLHRGMGLRPAQEVYALEDELAAKTGREHALALNSGTSALHAALWALGVRSGDEVVVPGYGWWTDVTTPAALGAVPVIAPIGPDLMIDPELLRACFSRRTRAVILVDACGLAADTPGVIRVADEQGVPVIEDTCQALGATVNGRSSGTGAAATILSFQSYKIISGGEGGGLLTDDRETYLAAVRFHDAGLSRFAHGSEGFSTTPVGIGLNLRMNELTAAVVRTQLRRLDIVTQRLRVARERLLGALAPVLESGRVQSGAPRSGWLGNGTFVVLTADDAATARSLKRALENTGCPVAIAGQDPLHGMPGWRNALKEQRLPHRIVAPERSVAILDRTLTLPVNWQQSDAQLESLAAAADGWAAPWRRREITVITLPSPVTAAGSQREAVVGHRA